MCLSFLIFNYQLQEKEKIEKEEQTSEREKKTCNVNEQNNK